MSMSTRGPSLPPRVTGELIGTLTIRFLACSTADTYARIQFWGESRFSYVYPLNNESITVGSHAIDFPLVGSILALNSYLTDASPLQISFWRQNKACQHPQWLGSTYIRDLYSNMPHLDSALTKTLLLNLKMVRPGMNDNMIHVIGEVFFELVFELYAHLDGETPIASSLTPLAQDSSHIRKSLMRKFPCNCDRKCTQILKDDSVSEQSDFVYASSIAENQSLLEELMQLCNDDMTIPTVESVVHSCFDRYDDWISRIVATANSPPEKVFPCLVPRGPNKSNALQKVSLLKLDIIDMSLMVKFANKVKSKVLYLQYHSHLLSELSNDVDVVEIRLHKKPRKQPKLVQTGRRSTAMKTKVIGINDDILLHRIAYAKQMEVEFSRDDSVHRWLEGTLDFSLFCPASNESSHPRLPRVATLAGKTRNSTPFSRNTGKVLLAKACLGLCNVIQAESLSVGLNLDLVTARNDILEVVDAGKVIGSLSIKLSLFSGERPECSNSSSATSDLQNLQIAGRNEQVSMKSPNKSPSVSTPHPISILLSHLSGVEIEDCVAESSSAIDNTRNIEHTACENTGYLQQTNITCDQNELLHPVTTTPDWLWVRVEKMTNLFLADVKEKGCLKLGMSCAIKLPQHGNVPPFSEIGYIKKSYDGSVVPINSVCSWQFPFEMNTTLVDDIVVVLRLSHCHNTADDDLVASNQCLVGLTKITFRAKPTDKSQIRLCNWIPGLVAQGPFDMLDPITNTLVGKFDVAIAHGTQQQIDDLTKTYQSILAIQRLWKRSRTINKKYCEGPNNSQLVAETKPESPEKDVSRDFNQEFDTIHVAFIKQHDRSGEKELTSPDSLFEEWSQQPMTGSKSGYMNVRGDIIGDVHHDTDSIDSLRPNNRNSFQPLHADFKSRLIQESEAIYSNLEQTICGYAKEEDELQMNLCESAGNERQRNDMSCMKPTRLEDSFSRSQENDIRPNIGIDPPEEINHICKRTVENATERVSEAHEKPGRNLWHPLPENPNVLGFTCPSMSNPLQGALHNEQACLAHFARESMRSSESESSVGCSRIEHKEEDDDETMSFRSLTSVLGTLERIDSILACGEFLQGKCFAPDDTTNFLSAFAQHDLLDAKMTIDDDNIRLRKIERPDPGRHIEPPEEKNIPACPGRSLKENQNMVAVMDSAHTCERGSSPMSALANRLMNASTSPSNNISTDDTIVNGIGDTQPIRIGEESQSKDVEGHQSEDKSDDDIIAKGRDHESDERSKHVKQLDAETSSIKLDQLPHIRCRERYLTTKMTNEGDVPIQNNSLQSMMHSRSGEVSPHPIRGPKLRGSLSPIVNYMDPPKRYCYFPRAMRRTHSSNIKIGASEKLRADKMGALFVDTERLERIFRS